MLRPNKIHRKTIQAIVESSVCRIFRWPYLWVANIFMALGLFNLRKNLEYCLSAMPDNLEYIPDTFVSVLVIGEDHRNLIHFGVDPIAITRAVVSTLFWRKQGGSTIEQQFVRVTLADYEQTFNRKLREQLTATLLSQRTNRRAIAKAYLEKAYYGTIFNGLHALERSYGKSLCDMSLDEIVEITARLKYPQPLRESTIWREKFQRRCSWIKLRLERARMRNGDETVTGTDEVNSIVKSQGEKQCV